MWDSPGSFPTQRVMCTFVVGLFGLLTAVERAPPPFSKAGVFDGAFTLSGRLEDGFERNTKGTR